MVVEQAVDRGQKLRFVKWLDYAGIGPERSYPVGGRGFRVGGNKEARHRDAISKQAVAQSEATHAGELHIDNQAVHAKQAGISQCALGGFVGRASVVVRT